MTSAQNKISYNTCFVVFLLQALFVLIFFSYVHINANSTQTEEVQSSLSYTENKTNVIILLWTWPFGSPFPLNKCENPSESSGCFFTTNRSAYQTAHAVIFHHRDVCNSKSQMPQVTRPLGQYWVWFNKESPTHSPNLGFMDNLINLTMSYRSDSDIFTPYGWLEKHSVDQNFTIPKKTKLAAWVVSNWNPNSRRVKFYEELKNFMQVDVYGRQHKVLSRELMKQTLSTYKFYFAFENSQHTDYITEKLWKNALSSGAVPVVLGPPRANYERYIPRDSFIHVDDFPTTKELANYLLELDKDDVRYQQYFKWRSKLWPLSNTSLATQYCNACKPLKDAPGYRTRPSLAKWFT